jgi:hypothetical protein
LARAVSLIPAQVRRAEALEPLLAKEILDIDLTFRQ